MALTAFFNGLFACLRLSTCAASEPRPAPSPSSSDATHEQQQTDVRPSLERTHVVHSILLSHSGKGKSFVERLYELKNAGHDPSFDEHSIQRGTQFSECMFDDFMSSKWPMIELELLTNFAEVMPLFYKLSPEDLKSPMNLLEWRKKWHEIARKDGRIDVYGWEKVVKCLATWAAGEVNRSEASEGDYIKKVGRAVCQKLLPRVLYDVSYPKGNERFIQDVEARFQNALATCKPSSNTPIVGMHGVGGLGKTTLQSDGQLLHARLLSKICSHRISYLQGRDFNCQGVQASSQATHLRQ